MSLIKRIAKRILELWVQLIEPRIISQLKTEYLLERALHSTEQGVAQFKMEEENIIVSLTTHGKRIFDVSLVIESLFEQTVKPNKFILWLAEDEFNETTIPLVLKRQQKRGLEIGFCKDIKSYKKLIPTLEQYPDQIIITVDDDILYPYDMIENLYKGYLSDTTCVYYCRGHKMTFDKRERLKPYNSWFFDYQGEEKSLYVLPTGIGGVLYPPNYFHQDVLRTDLFTKLAPTADDIWFKAMTLLNGVFCKKVSCSMKAIDLYNYQDIGLWITQNRDGGNDIQIKQVFDYYNLWDKLKLMDK
jgi:hypothetical protein